MKKLNANSNSIHLGCEYIYECKKYKQIYIYYEVPNYTYPFSAWLQIHFNSTQMYQKGNRANKTRNDYFKQWLAIVDTRLNAL